MKRPYQRQRPVGRYPPGFSVFPGRGKFAEKPNWLSTKTQFRDIMQITMGKGGAPGGRMEEKAFLQHRSAGPCSCKQTSTTYRSVNPRFENRGFFMLYEGKTISRDKYTTICCGETQWYFHNIWWSRINIRVCSRFQCRKRGRDQCKDFCWLQMRISLCEVTKSMN